MVAWFFTQTAWKSRAKATLILIPGRQDRQLNIGFSAFQDCLNLKEIYFLVDAEDARF